MEYRQIQTNTEQEKQPAPEHKCKSWERQILVETHEVGASHNIVTYRKSMCKVCGKIFEEEDPYGVDKIFR